MKNFSHAGLVFLVSILFLFTANAQNLPKKRSIEIVHRCSTMEELQKAIQKDPSLPEKWRLEGERQYHLYQQRQQHGERMLQTQDNEIIIPIVFHLVDQAGKLAGITDRDIYEQVEMLNRDYHGKKIENYKGVIPFEILASVGKIPIKFVLARRTPGGALTSGIERRTGATPSHVNIKSAATGGLDAWDTNKYLNVWCGTFSGSDNGLLGIATFPFTSGEGGQGVVIGINTLPYTSTTARGYYPTYSEAATLAHEIGHYFYLWHTFGDLSSCNNQDFRIQSGWPLPNGAGPEGDDTPSEKAGPGNAYYGNPSMNYADGCSSESFGMMYGSYMNYFDDRALFMFSDGQRKRVLGCIDLYRPGLKTSDGAIPPVAVTDAFLVDVSSRGYPERRSYVVDNTPLQAIVRNSGTAVLTSVSLNVSIDGGPPVTTDFILSLAPGEDTVLNLAPISGGAGNHTLNVYTSAPNNSVDNFPANDSLFSFINIAGTTVSAPLTEDFSGSFPPAGWQIWNFNNNTTWAQNPSSGFSAAGSAYVDNFNYNGGGQMDELITPAIDLGANDSSVLSFRVAHAVYDDVDVSGWDGLEVYVSYDGGIHYDLVYKKTGNQLKTVASPQTQAFSATPAEPNLWRLETVNLSPFIIAGKKMIVKFRNTNAFGNNIFIDDVSITAATKASVDISAQSFVNTPSFTCGSSVSPFVAVRNNAANTVNNYKISYSLDNGAFTATTINTALPGAQTTTVNVGLINNLSIGSHLLTVVANSPNGSNDLIPANDTIRKTIVVFPTVSAPITESFEGTSFPPVGWAINNPDDGITWSKSGTAVRKVQVGDSASAVVRNYGYAGSHKTDELYSPILNYSGIDSIFLKFDLASAPKYTGGGFVPDDTLEVLITTDCGASLQSVYKKWGVQLQTVDLPNDPNQIEFNPGSQNIMWRRDSIDLLPYLGTSSSFQLVFRSSHNAPGNDVYIDNINVSTKILPTTLKQQGYLILPTAFNNRFAVWHYEQPTTLKFVNVYNSIGQLVWTRKYNGNAEKLITVDLSSKAAGVYFVRLGYTDSKRDISKRVIKY